MELNPEETIAQLGGYGLSSALTYCGVSKMYNVKSKGAIWFKVNGRRGYQTYIEVKLDPSDTYTVTLMSKRGSKPMETHNSRSDVYCDELQGFFEALYDEHMNKLNAGFIPID